ncbi:MAG: glycosyltransferase family 4 protein [Chloroflexi bacterium]|nr:glycosyltransferase family 4 protein [Chloroflexota bacterium]
MRILVLSQWYPPEPDTRIHLLAKTLVARGHQVTAITGFPNYPSGHLYPGYSIRWRQWEIRDGVQVLRVPLYPNHNQSSIKRIANYASFALSASFLGAAWCGPADVMWVYHPPLTIGLPAWCISRLRRIPFVYEIQDLWPETLAATGMFRSRRGMALVDRFARGVYARASAITVISPGFKRNLIAKGVPADKIHVIPNWADEELYYPVPRDETLAHEYGLLGKFNIIYGGNLGAAQSLDNVLNAATLLNDLPDTQFVLVGDGVEEERLQRAVRERDIRNVRLIGRQPAEKMAQFFAWADALLVHLRRDPLFEITIPGKTIAYLACGRPILGAIAGDAAEMIRNAQAGIICAPEDPAALARAVRQLHAMPHTQREAMGQSGRRAFLDHYTRTVLIGRYEELFTQIADQHTIHLNVQRSTTT